MKEKQNKTTVGKLGKKGKQIINSVTYSWPNNQ